MIWVCSSFRTAHFIAFAARIGLMVQLYACQGKRSSPPPTHHSHTWREKNLAQRCERLLMGVPGDHDGPICPADHWHATPARHTQAVTSSGASAESLSRNLLIRLLNSSNTCYAVPRPCPCHGVKNTLDRPACIFFLPLVGSPCNVLGSPFHQSWVLARGAGEQKAHDFPLTIGRSPPKTLDALRAVFFGLRWSFEACVGSLCLGIRARREKTPWTALQAFFSATCWVPLQPAWVPFPPVLGPCQWGRREKKVMAFPDPELGLSAVLRPCPCVLGMTQHPRVVRKTPSKALRATLVGCLCDLRGSPFHLSGVLACGAGEKKAHDFSPTIGRSPPATHHGMNKNLGAFHPSWVSSGPVHASWV